MKTSSIRSGASFGPLQRGADHVGTELVGAERRQFAHEAAERGAGGGKDDDWIEAAAMAVLPEMA